MTVILRIVTLFCCISLFFLSCSTPRSLSSISTLLGKYQNDKTDRIGKQFTFWEIRKKMLSEYQNKTAFNSDTIFFLETYNVEYDTYSSSIWDMKDTVNFEFQNHKIKFYDKRLFTSRTLKLISDWDTVGLRKEELKFLNSKRKLYASRYISRNEAALISVIKFNELEIEY